MSNVEEGAAVQACIVVPLLNQRNEWLEHAILSAVQQTVPTRVIVVTSQHTGDPNRQMLAGLSSRFENLRVLERDPGVGFAGALNLGIRSAASDRVGFLLSDDWLEPGAVEACLRHDTDIVSTSLNYYRETETGLRQLPHPLLTIEAFDRLPLMSAKASYLEHFFLFKKEALLDVGGVDETIGLVGPDDYDLIWTLLELGASVAVVAEPLYNYRDHETEIDRLTLRAYQDKRVDLEKILDKHGVIGEERETILEKQRISHFARFEGRSTEPQVE